MVAVAIGLGVAGAASAIGSVVSSSGAKQAASTEAAASEAATAEQTAAREQEQQNIAPYLQYGTTAGNELTSELQSGALGAAAPTDQTQIANFPGYQFTLQQGLLSTQNAAAAQGLGVSGAALKGAASYATGLAATNYQNFFNDYWSNQNNRYNMLANTMNMGANAASNLNTNLTSSSNSEASNINTAAANVGNAQQSAANATGTGISNLGSGVSNALLANALLGQTQGGSTLGSGTNSTYTNPSTGTTYLSSSNPNANF